MSVDQARSIRAFVDSMGEVWDDALQKSLDSIPVDEEAPRGAEHALTLLRRARDLGLRAIKAYPTLGPIPVRPRGKRARLCFSRFGFCQFSH